MSRNGSPAHRFATFWSGSLLRKTQGWLLSLVFVVVVGGVLVVLGVGSRYRRDLEAARARLESAESRVVRLESGDVEYSDFGSGPCLIVSHGIFHGCDGGQRSVRDVVSGLRVISPSRFGYLGSSMPEHATGADQADAFVALLDHVDIDEAYVMGISAGTSAALQVALRHSDRVSHVVISSGNWPGSPTSEAPPGWARLFYNDPTMWLLRAIAPSVIRGLMGVPKGFPKDDEQAAYVEEMLDSIFPLGPRAEGAIFDAFSSNPEINDYPLEQIRVPTLIIHSQDDPLASYDAARVAAERIPEATLVGLESGGHLGLGQTARMRDAIADFLVAT